MAGLGKLVMVGDQPDCQAVCCHLVHKMRLWLLYWDDWVYAKGAGSHPKRLHHTIILSGQAGEVNTM